MQSKNAIALWAGFRLCPFVAGAADAGIFLLGRTPSQSSIDASWMTVSELAAS
jgi:hypothetical protein